MRLWAAGLILAGLLAARLCHLDIVWVEEGYPAAAALQLLDGKALYKDVWFDKPPLSPYLYTLWGAHTGLPLRLAGAGFVFSCCLLLWTEGGPIAAALLAFFLTFGIPSALLPLAPDLLMIAPHIGAVVLAMRGRAFLAGLAAGIGLLVNSKAVFVLAACLLWTWRSAPLTLLGFVLPNLAAFAWFGQPYWEEVWKWGAVYSRHGFVFSTGITRTLDWIGFHAAAVLGATVAPKDWRYIGWVVISLVAVCAGWRFFPRYYFQLLVPVVFLAARGFVFSGPKMRAAILALLLIPLIRFGPRYVILASDEIHGRPHHWSDLALSQDSEAVARLIQNRPGTLLVWGYRPDIFALTRKPAGTRFLDSQPLTGVIADRHLTSSEVAYPDLAARNRQELTRTSPTLIVDGLGLFNPNLAITNYPDLKNWLDRYREIGRTRFSVIYQLLPDPTSRPLLEKR